MKKKVLLSFLFTFILIISIGILLAQVVSNECSCYEACYACIWDNEGQDFTCKIYDGPGGCFCIENPCRLSEHFICCVHN